MVGFLSWSTHCCLMCSLSSTSMPKSFSTGLLLIHLCPSLYRYWGRPWCRCRPGPRPWRRQTSQNSYRPTSLGWSLSGWLPFPLANQLHLLSVVSSANLLKAYSNPLHVIGDTELFRSHYGPWGTALISDLCLDIEQLTANLWMQLPWQFLIYLTVCSSNPYLSNLMTNGVVGDTIKGPTEGKPL